jgi:putative sterol carrier protein
MPNLTARDVIEGSPKFFRPQQAKGVDAIIQFDVTGSECFQGYLTVKDGACTYTEGLASHPTLTIKTPADVWVKLTTGQLSPQTAFLKRAFQVQGDMMLLMRMGQMFGGQRA